MSFLDCLRKLEIYAQFNDVANWFCIQSIFCNLSQSDTIMFRWTSVGFDQLGIKRIPEKSTMNFAVVVTFRFDYWFASFYRLTFCGAFADMKNMNILFKGFLQNCEKRWKMNLLLFTLVRNKSKRISIIKRRLNMYIVLSAI